MKEYLKMDDVFDGIVNVSSVYGYILYTGNIEDDDSIDEHAAAFNETSAKYLAHAINSHDELVAEVERLKKAVELASMTLDEVDRVLTERIKNGAYDLDDISAEVEGAIKRLSETE